MSKNFTKKNALSSEQNKLREHSNYREVGEINRELNQKGRGQNYAFIISVLSIGIAFYMGNKGQAYAAIGLANIMYRIVALFITGKRPE